jgi:hypothetical protein
MYKEIIYIINLKNVIHSGILDIVIMDQDANFLILKFKKIINYYQYKNHLY